MNLLITIKMLDSYGLFKLMFTERKENLSGFNAELDSVIFIDSELGTSHL